MWLGIAVVMLIPILMIFPSLILNQPAHRWVHIIVAAFYSFIQCRWFTNISIVVRQVPDCRWVGI